MLSTADHKINSRRRFLLRHFSSPGLLCGLDLVSGTDYKTISPHNHIEYMETHLGGPELHRRGTHAVAYDETGKWHSLTSFFRTRAYHYDSDLRTSGITLVCSDQYSINPTFPVVQLAAWLDECSIPFVVERSMRIGEWVFWIFLDHRESLESVQAYGSKLFSAGVQSRMIDERSMSMPILRPKGDSVSLPWLFYCESFFGQLHHLHRGNLTDAEPSTIPHLNIGSGNMNVFDFAGEDPNDALLPLLTHWRNRFGFEKVRAGDLINMAVENGLPLENLTQETDGHAQCIALGHLLWGSVGTDISGMKINARPSGHSSIYWLTAETQDTIQVPDRENAIG